MPALRIHGYVIVSAEGMLADERGVMPDALKIPGDQEFFAAALDRVDLIVHGRGSFEDQPNSPRRTRIILSRTVAGVACDPANSKATLWNPAGASFTDACHEAGVHRGTVAVLGGPGVFAMFFDRYETFFLSQAPHVRLPGGQGCFPGVPARSPQAILASHGLVAGEMRMLDAAHQVSVTAWHRPA